MSHFATLLSLLIGTTQFQPPPPRVIGQSARIPKGYKPSRKPRYRRGKRGEYQQTKSNN